MGWKTKTSVDVGGEDNQQPSKLLLYHWLSFSQWLDVCTHLFILRSVIKYSNSLQSGRSPRDQAKIQTVPQRTSASLKWLKRYAFAFWVRGVSTGVLTQQSPPPPIIKRNYRWRNGCLLLKTVNWRRATFTSLGLSPTGWGVIVPYLGLEVENGVSCTFFFLFQFDVLVTDTRQSLYFTPKESHSNWESKVHPSYLQASVACCCPTTHYWFRFIVHKSYFLSFQGPSF